MVLIASVPDLCILFTLNISHVSAATMLVMKISFEKKKLIKVIFHHL